MRRHHHAAATPFPSHPTLALTLLLALTALLSFALTPALADDFPVCPSPPAANTIVSCAPGSYNNGQNCCYQCSPGTYSNATNPAQCIPCAIGKFAHLAGQTACNSCLGGHYSPETGASACALCYPGSYTNGGGATQCTLCTSIVKAYSPDPGAFTCANSCTDPNNEVSPDGTQCKPVSGAAAPTPATACTDGNYVSFDGSQCIQCPEGTAAAGTNQRFCNVCTAGKISQGTMNSVCTQCSAGTFSRLSGTTLCGDCASGTFSAAGATACTTCGVNTYQPATGQSGCLACVGEAQPSSCTTCTPGRFLDTSPGTFGINTCTACSSGSYSTTSNAPTCTFCSPGTYQAATRQTVCVVCAPGTITSNQGLASCSPCAAGFYSNSNNTACIPCAPGTISPVDGSADCMSCGPQTYQPDSGKSVCLNCDGSNGAVVNSANTTCAVPVLIPECLFGQAYNATNGTCVDCPIGTASNLRNPESCTPCEPGHYQPLVGQPLCLLCSPGSATNFSGQTACALCDVGYVAALSGSKTCTSCDSGFFSNSTGQASCFPCSRGSVANGTALTQCTPCSPGTIQQDLGFSKCVPCVAGKVQPLAGQTKCVDCAIGTARNTSGEVACVACSSGRYTPVNGTRVCTECPLGTATALVGQSACASCVPGFFSSTFGSLACQSCPDATYQPSPRSSACMNCTGQTILGATMCLAPGTVTANITINMDYTLITASAASRTAFESAFLRDLARYSGSNATQERYKVLLLTPGSTRVWFAILPPITSTFNVSLNRTVAVSTAGVQSAATVMDLIVKQLMQSPPPNPSLLRNGTIWSSADNNTLVYQTTCQNDTTGEIYTLQQDTHCRVTLLLNADVDSPGTDHYTTYAIIIGCSIAGGLLCIGLIFAACFHRRGVRRKEKQVAQWGQEQPRETPIGEEEPDSDEEHVDGVKPHPIVWGY